MKTTSEERAFTVWIRDKHQAILDGFFDGPDWFNNIDPAFRAGGLARMIVDLIYLLERFPDDVLEDLKKDSAEWPIRVATKKLPNSTVLPNLLARYYFGLLNAHRRSEIQFAEELDDIAKLPDFTVKTARQWGAAAWKMLCDDYNGHPEENRYIAQLGEHRRKHSVTQGAQKKTTPATERANIRDGIKESLCPSIHQAPEVT
jgi:hypothetical protein